LPPPSEDPLSPTLQLRGLGWRLPALAALALVPLDLGFQQQPVVA